MVGDDDDIYADDAAVAERLFRRLSTAELLDLRAAFVLDWTVAASPDPVNANLLAFCRSRILAIDRVLRGRRVH